MNSARTSESAAAGCPATSKELPVVLAQRKDEHYSVYTREEKWFMVSVIAIAGIFSPLTVSVYYPAIPDIAVAFNKSVEMINLSVTAYMVFQGISPMFWGTFSDRKGRRLIFISCMLILSLSCLGLAVIPTSAYWLLIVLRCAQAAGSASTIALGAGVVGDITTAAERGSMYGFYNIGPLIGPAIGPVIGGLIDDKLGWRAIFWFLCISTAVCALFLVLFMPETLRSIVGDGSIKPPKIHRPLIPIIGRKRTNTSTKKPLHKPLTNPFRLLLQPDVASLLLFNGIIMGIFYTIGTTLSELFKEAYPYLTKSDIGYCYLATGGSMFFGTLTSGRILDADYRRIQTKLSKEAAQDAEKNGEGATCETLDPSKFPIERARLGKVPFFVFLLVGSCAAYGWCIGKKVHIAIPLLMQIIYGFTAVYTVNATQTLLIDLVPSQGSSITACNNVVRCSIGAVIVAVINPILSGIGAGWTFMALAAIGALFSGFLLVVVKIGPRYRQKRLEQRRALEATPSSS